MKKTKQKNRNEVELSEAKSRLGQYDAKYFLTDLNISEPLRFATLHRSVFNDLQKVFLTLYGPRSLDDLLAYEVKGRKATNQNSVHFALGQESQSKGGIRGPETLGPASVALRSRDEHRVNSLDLCGTFYQGKVPRQFGMDDKRNLIMKIATAELGTREATGHNDGARVEEYLAYTHLGKGYEWCAAFVSWCYGQAGLSQPRNPWSPALFPKSRLVNKVNSKPADVFGIYSNTAKRIHHVGLIKELQGSYIVSIEGNSNNRVESRRRHLRTIHSAANWID